MLWLHLGVEQAFRGVEMNMESYSFDNALLMCLDGRWVWGVWVWLFYSWQRPWGLLAGVFHGRMRKDATIKIVLLIPLCLVSSATFHEPQLHSAAFLLLLRIVMDCLALKKMKIMLIETTLTLLFSPFLSFSCSIPCFGNKKGTLRAGVTCSVLEVKFLIVTKPIVTRVIPLLQKALVFCVQFYPLL